MKLNKINDYTFEIPKEGKMLVPGRIFANDKLIEQIKSDKSIEQCKNVATLTGIKDYSFVMGDAHMGYGFPIGGVAAFDVEKGVVSPGGIGFDINCGVRLIRTDYTYEQIMEKREELINQLFREVPAGVGKNGPYPLSVEELKEVLLKGIDWAIEKGYATKEDKERVEENGRFHDADHSAISEKALKRGLNQLGTLGCGNHFLEIQKVDKIYDEKTAKAFGIDKEGQAVVMVHCGSRGFGHQVATDYVKKMEAEFGYDHLVDRMLINAPLKSDLGQEYYRSMSCAINYAFANRQLITHGIRKAFEKVMGSSKGMDLVYDVCHNIGKYEEHNGERVFVHRKGATRAFGPGRKEVPEVYRSVGQPVMIPGSMGTASYVLVGSNENQAFGSACHGAGRVMSRSQAKRDYNADQIKKEMADKGILVKSSTWRGIVEEAPQVYKDIDEVIDVTVKAKLANKVVRLVPVGVVKG